MLRPRADVEVTEASTAHEAKRLLVDEDFDVLVIDGDLAPQGGFSFLYEFHLAAEHGRAARPRPRSSSPRGPRTAGWPTGRTRTTTLPKPVDPFAVARAVDELTAAPA